MSAVICLFAKVIAANVSFPAGIISTSSFLTVCLVTAAPQVFRPLAKPGSIVGVFLLQVNAFRMLNQRNTNTNVVVDPDPLQLLALGVRQHFSMPHLGTPIDSL
mmetsp:Transcript_24291/g.95600  ORF Transcript_24291/g.95600 Transcript_24291/m.95600 type:complete len:104 (-) Transcript_24291:1551-1862(-)